jgi:hypothetical protein
MKKDQKKIALFILTAGRKEYLDTTIKSLNKNLKGNIVKKIIFDGSDNQNIFYENYDTVIVPSFGIPYGSKRHAKTLQFIFNISNKIDADIICFFEEDWELLEEINLDYLSDHLTGEVSQIRFFRPLSYNYKVSQVISENFSIVNDSPYMFSWNPSIFDKKLMSFDYPTESHDHELAFGKLLSKPFMVYKNGGSPVIKHIGKISVSKPWYVHQ